MQNTKLVLNGYIIQKVNNSYYCGIDGDNWYLNYCSDNSYFEEFYDKNIDNGLANSEVVACCTDVEYMRRYVEESKKLGIPFRVLLCVTNRQQPVLGTTDFGFAQKKLGYDVAYSGGSYYSCVLNDVVSGRIPEFQSIRLNDNGLFSSYEEAEAFLKQREELEKATTEYTFEKGDYVIYKLSEVAV